MEFACAIVSLAGRVEVRRVERRPIVLAGSGAKSFFSPPLFFLKFSTRFSFGLFFFIYERSNVFCGVKSIDRFYDSFIFGDAVLFVSFSFFSLSSPLSRLSECTRCLCKVFVNGKEKEKCVDYWYFSIARCVLKRRLENFSRTFARV